MLGFEGRLANNANFNRVRMNLESKHSKPKTKEIVNVIDVAVRIQPNYTDNSKDQSRPPLDPKELSDTLKDAVIEYLKYHEGLLNIEIAHVMKIHPSTVIRKLSGIAERRALELHKRGYNIWTVVEKIEATCELVQRKARDNNDWRLYLDAEIKKWTELQKLGVVYEKPLEVDIKAVFTETQARAIIDILAEDEQKALDAGNHNGGYQDEQGNDDAGDDGGIEAGINTRGKGL